MTTKQANIACRPGTTDAMQRLADENEALRAERDSLAARDERLTNCIDTVRDLIMLLDEDCFGTGHRQDCQPWSIRDEVLDGMNKLMNETPAQSLAYIRAAGAREALERAMQESGFSGTVVRVDVMREIIEQMEGES